ncbi:MAG TPA: biopolymer transporter ExbD [Gemmatimonadaceae bacterium]|nr:biopolymer transporter ExbD [Gemmatimonadaceae bacterium]
MTSQFTPPPIDPPIVRAAPGTHHRARAARLARRAAQFNKFRLIQLNLVPLVDTFVSVVFFSLVTATVGELAPIVPGVNLPESRVGQPALQQITLGIGPQVTLGGRAVMSTLDAAQAQSDNPAQPLMIPPLYAALRAKADSIRAQRRVAGTESVDAPLAIQADRTMRYDLLSRVMQTARLAGFRNVTLQVNRVGDATAAVRPS